ncbi:hypothetical protein Mal15_00200 [Stieleria maiorica]|uniref:Uncharacterized protein n=1 Tax=Stieleria maiorica TaxID=2795974 RepID=A0A5B9M8X2_9BACT|nr:hypothetical protein [Stieleria maiorica]QEF95994.1 hypothetical protein Mal15_00200 [Stieleria maiorica]
MTTSSPNQPDSDRMVDADDQSEPIDIGPLRLVDVPGFLVGRRASMERTIASKASLALGAALVATAALAREYDAVSFLHQPLDLLAPFAASVLVSAILFVVLRSFHAITRIDNPAGIVDDYRVFLSGYWMTAPLAWLYSIPIETMTDEVAALRFNLTLLSIVSIWRVLLLARFVSVRYRVSLLAALSWVLAPCMAIAVVALFQRIMSMVSIMGGLRLTETQQILLEFRSNVFGLSFYGFIPALLLGIGLAIAIRKGTDRTAVRRFRPSITSRSAWAIPIVAFAVLAIAACYFQPDRYRAAEVDRLLIDGRLDDAIAVMQQHGRHQFPSVWDPPPTFPTRRRPVPPMSELLSAIQRNTPDRWVIDRLLVQADELLMWEFGWTQGVRDESYLESTLYITDSDALTELHEHFQTLAEMPAGEEERNRRIRLLKIVKESIPKAEAFEKDLPVSEVADSEVEDSNTERQQTTRQMAE